MRWGFQVGRIYDRPTDIHANMEGIALCPNCHRRVHAGGDGKEFNAQLTALMNGIEHIRAALTTNRLVSMNEAMEADNTANQRGPLQKLSSGLRDFGYLSFGSYVR
jgi:hypothetical protein